MNEVHIIIIIIFCYNNVYEIEMYVLKPHSTVISWSAAFVENFAAEMSEKEIERQRKNPEHFSNIAPNEYM